MSLYLLIVVVFLFSIIHFFEFLSFYSRIAGIRTDNRLISYSLQQTTFVGTRFFFIFLMPILGFIVDSKVSKNTYLIMVIFSLIFASISYLFAYCIRDKIIFFFNNVIEEYNKNTGYLKSILKSIYKVLFLSSTNGEKVKELEGVINKKMVILSALIFCSYSIAVFLSFYFSLVFYEYRSTISQLSGVINAFATLILTLYIEPGISRSIDKKLINAEYDVYSLLLGRFLGVAILSPIIVILVGLI